MEGLAEAEEMHKSIAAPDPAFLLVYFRPKPGVFYVNGRFAAASVVVAVFPHCNNKTLGAKTAHKFLWRPPLA